MDAQSVGRIREGHHVPSAHRTDTLGAKSPPSENPPFPPFSKGGSRGDLSPPLQKGGEGGFTCSGYLEDMDLDSFLASPDAKEGTETGKVFTKFRPRLGGHPARRAPFPGISAR